LLEAAMAVVVADGVGRAQVRDPARLKHGDQPGLVLARDGDGARDGHGERASGADRAIEDVVRAPQVRSPEGRQAVLEQLVERRDLVDAGDFDVLALVFLHYGIRTAAAITVV